MKKTIAVLPGDGIGPEIIEIGVKILKTIAKRYHHDFSFTEGFIGGAAIEKFDNPYPSETQKICKSSDAILFGAIGDPKFDNNPDAKIRPEQGLLAMRKDLGLFANIRPIQVFEGINKSPLKNEIIKDVDFIVVRELTGGIYFSKPRILEEEKAIDTCIYTTDEIIRVAKIAFELAKNRKQKLTLVDKANVLATSQLWRKTIQTLSKNYSDITVDYMFVDNAAMQIIKRPSEFDVILTENMFGDILTDEASVIAGSLGMLPSASIGKNISLFEPIHGSYPKAKGKNSANPTGTILSAALLLEYSFGLLEEAKVIRKAVEQTIQNGFGTRDIIEKNPLSTTEFGNKILEALA